jgi:hypothetical protein
MDSYVAKQESAQLIQRMYKLTTNRYLQQVLIIFNLVSS